MSDSALIIEDGQGVEGANSYLTVTDLLAEARRTGLTCPDNVDLEAALIRATSWLDSYVNWSGARTNGRNQGLQFPRKDMYDAEGYLIDSEGIPIEIKKALTYATIKEASQAGILSPEIQKSKTVKSVSVDGAVSLEYADAVTLEDQRLVLTAVDDILKTLVKNLHIASRVIQSEALRS